MATDTTGCRVGGDDCDDTNPGRFPGNPEVCDTFDVDEDCNPLTFGTLDEDDDGHVDLACCNEDTAGMRYCGDDCADQRRDTRPGMPEVCDGIDNDCDTMLDEGVTVTGRPDMDFDLHGDEGAQAIMRCADTQGFSVLSDDCDDGRVTAHSAQLEICDGLDNDCDDLLDENAVAVAWYPDDDVDGFGDADATPVISCAVVSGHAVRTGDCDDSDQSLSPSAAERCDGRDNNCDGVANFLINFGDTEDDDEDGFPDMRCGGNDCNDGNPSVYPGAMELCDGVDNDCDGVVDADSADALWYLDLDGDGFGDATGGTMLSCTPIANRIARGGDCDDGDAGIRPAANDACNGIDDDCDGTTDESGLRFPFYPDDDDDGVGDTSGGVIFACPGREPAGVSQAQGDCDDDDDTVYAGAPELCDGDDNDCDGVTDEDAPQAWFPDGDSDGRGVPAGGMTTCNPPAGYVLFSDDCNDLDANNFPTNAESCDGVDNDCDSQADDGADAACMLSTGMGVCSMGACLIADCAAGRDDCDTTFGRRAARSTRIGTPPTAERVSRAAAWVTRAVPRVRSASATTPPSCSSRRAGTRCTCCAARAAPWCGAPTRWESWATEAAWPGPPRSRAHAAGSRSMAARASGARATPPGVSSASGRRPAASSATASRTGASAPHPCPWWAWWTPPSSRPASTTPAPSGRAARWSAGATTCAVSWARAQPAACSPRPPRRW
jgi:hypothetical protein